MSRLPRRWPRKEQFLEGVLWLVAMLLGGLQAWRWRFDFAAEDIVSYLDVADAYLRGDWNLVVNGHWSPIYSWLLGLAQVVLGFSPFWDTCRVKIVNYVIFLLALGCFRFFLHELMQFTRQRSATEDAAESRGLPAWLLIVGGYGLFLWSALRWTGLYCDTPDLLMAALFYLACAMILRLQTRSDHWLRYAGLGVVLGLGYLTKTAMFPLAFVFLAISIRGWASLRRMLVALLAFAVVAGPFVAALSLKKGRFTFGDTGTLTYIWFVNPGPKFILDHHWQGGPASIGNPLHPTRQLYDDPPLFEFAQPLESTYPPWIDPTYWYEGIKVQFDLGQQGAAIAKNLMVYVKTLGLVWLPGLVLVLVGGRRVQTIRTLAAGWRSLAPAVVGLGLYLVCTDFPDTSMDMQPSTRFIAAFLVVLFAVTFTSMRFSSSRQPRLLLMGLIGVSLTVAAGRLYYQTGHAWLTSPTESQGMSPWQIAADLGRLGIQPGDPVAIIGNEEYHEPWARLARVRIIAQVVDANAFAGKDKAVQAQVLSLIEATGARVVVLTFRSDPPTALPGLNWKPAGKDLYFVHFFDEAERAGSLAQRD